MNREEERLQMACVRWFNLQYPQYHGLLNCNLNNSSNKISGKRNKDMGVIRGRSDLVLYFASTATHIELKTDKGRQSQAQKDWQQLIESQGFKYYIIRSIEKFVKLINHIINER